MNRLRNPEDIINNVQSLYSLPGVAAQVLELTRNPQTSIVDLKKCLEQDPALVVKLLRVVNSSLFGLSRTVVDLQQAMNVIGINPLRMLVLGFCLPERLFLFTNRDILGRYWHRTLLKATIARQLRQVTNSGANSGEDDAFIVGLLSDIGLLVMLQEYNGAFASFLDVALKKADSLVHFEEMALGVDHCKLGSSLIKRWNLPDHLVRLVEAGTEEVRIRQLPGNEQSLAQTLLLADRLAWCLAEDRKEFWPMIYEMIKVKRIITQDQLQTIVRDVQLQIEQLAEALSLPDFTSENYELLTLSALEQLSQLTEQQITQSLRGMQLRPLERIDEEVRALQAAAELKYQNQLTANSKAVVKNDSSYSVPQEEMFESITKPTSVDRYDGSTSIPRQPSIAVAPKPAKIDFDEIVPEDLRCRLRATLTTCRQSHSPVSLMLVEIDRFDMLVDKCGLIKAEKLNQVLALHCNSVDHPQAQSIHLTTSLYAVILPDCDRSTAVKCANELLEKTVATSHGKAFEQLGITMTASIGVATITNIPRNDTVEAIYTGAERCLSGAQLSGGKSVKSIEVF
jgi:HD-like signal output (HDOD) protein/GGDEF domain-containing protein